MYSLIRVKHCDRVQKLQYILKLAYKRLLQAVGYFGTNFELIAKIFKGKCRKTLANKWRRESKINSERCAEALRNKGGAEGYERLTGGLLSKVFPRQGSMED